MDGTKSSGYNYKGDDEMEFSDVTSEKVGEIILDAIRKIDNWSPTTCPLDELKYHLSCVEYIETIASEIANRAIYLRGVMAGRVIHEVSSK